MSESEKAIIKPEVYLLSLKTFLLWKCKIRLFFFVFTIICSSIVSFLTKCLLVAHGHWIYIFYLFGYQTFIWLRILFQLFPCFFDYIQFCFWFFILELIFYKSYQVIIHITGFPLHQILYFNAKMRKTRVTFFVLTGHEVFYLAAMCWWVNSASWRGGGNILSYDIPRDRSDRDGIIKKLCYIFTWTCQSSDSELYFWLLPVSSSSWPL